MQAQQQSMTAIFDMTGKVALVTGGAMGIGLGIATRLAEAGAAVMIADSNETVATLAVQSLTDHGYKAASISADVGRIADANNSVDATVKLFGHLDYLVNNAGIFPFTPAIEMTEAAWDKVLTINLKGTFFFSQAAAKEMLQSGTRGSIVNIASIDGLHPTGNLAHYDASKGGDIMLTKSLALEWGPLGIRVNAIAPGAINTPGARAGTTTSDMASTTGAAVLEQFMARIPLRRMGEPDDIAKAVLFLLSDAAAYITGSTLIVDGGYLLS